MKDIILKIQWLIRNWRSLINWKSPKEKDVNIGTTERAAMTEKKFRAGQEWVVFAEMEHLYNKTAWIRTFGT